MRQAPRNGHLLAAWSRAACVARGRSGTLGSQRPLGLGHGFGSRGQKPGGPRGGGQSWGSASGSELQTRLSSALLFRRGEPMSGLGLHPSAP